MPSRLKTRDQIPVDTIHLSGGEDWVKVRRWITGQDRDEINSKMTRVDMEKGTGTIDSSIANRVTVQQVLVAWGGPGFCKYDHEEGEQIDKQHVHDPAEITFELIGALPEADMNMIIKHVRSSNPRPMPPTTEDKKSPFPEEMPVGVS